MIVIELYVKYISRYGRRSNWFKIHCLMQQKPSAGSTIPYDLTAAAVPPLDLANPLRDQQVRQTNAGGINPRVNERNPRRDDGLNPAFNGGASTADSKDFSFGTGSSRSPSPEGNQVR